MSGEASRNAGNDFEKIIENTFEVYSESNVAELDFYPVPMRPTGIRDRFNKPLYQPKKKPPLDVWGYAINDGRLIVAELKSTQRKASIPIILPDKTGSGIQFHQLCMLRNVAMSGGIARLVWSNDGEVGVLKDAKIINAWSGAYTALGVEGPTAKGKWPAKAPTGLKSIKWEQFEVVSHQQINGRGMPIIPWLQHELFFESAYCGESLAG